MDLEEKTQLISKFPLEEIVTRDGLKSLLEVENHPKHYIGFEISGLMHVGTLIISGFKINDLIKAGVKCSVFLADWHSYINNKFEGDWEKISIAARYYQESFKFFCPGVEITHGSELYHNNDEYWKEVIRFTKQITLARNTRCLTIMGRTEKDKLDFSQYLYPPMQAVDIKTIGVDIAHAGMDQRKVHMLAREVFPKLGWKSPIAIHHHLLPGLLKPVRAGLDEDSKLDLLYSSKMSKSKPDTCIFIHDTYEDIKRKLRKSWCPEGITDNNPILEIYKLIVFHEFRDVEIDRPSKYGGRVTFEKYEDLERAFIDKKVHPVDLKINLANILNEIIAPIRKYFEKRNELLEVFSNTQDV
jgi:tyrosyl-tRNA synthetase